MRAKSDAAILLWKSIIGFFLVLFLLPPFACADQPFIPGSTLTLEDCVAVALRNHPDLRSMEQQVKASYLRTRQAKSPYWPQIGMYSNYNRRNKHNSWSA